MHKIKTLIYCTFWQKQQQSVAEWGGRKRGLSSQRKSRLLVETNSPHSHKSLSPATEREREKLAAHRKHFNSDSSEWESSENEVGKSESASGKSERSWRQKYYCSCVNSCQDGGLPPCPCVPAPKCVLKTARTPHKHNPKLTKEKHRGQKIWKFSRTLMHILAAIETPARRWTQPLPDIPIRLPFRPASCTHVVREIIIKNPLLPDPQSKYSDSLPPPSLQGPVLLTFSCSVCLF